MQRNRSMREKKKISQKEKYSQKRKGGKKDNKKNTTMRSRLCRVDKIIDESSSSLRIVLTSIEKEVKEDFIASWI